MTYGKYGKYNVFIILLYYRRNANKMSSRKIYIIFFFSVQGKICFTSLYHDQFNKDLNRNKTHIMR